MLNNREVSLNDIFDHYTPVYLYRVWYIDVINKCMHNCFLNLLTYNELRELL